MNKLKFIILASIAAILTISCSDDKDDEPSSNNVVIDNTSTESYPLLENENGYFTYLATDKDEYCEEGQLKYEDYPSYITVNYSIANDTLVWEAFGYYADTLNFSGPSDSLLGTWTRTRSKNSCNDDWGPYFCKEDYDITKLVFTDDSIKITREYCPTDEFIEGQIFSKGLLHIVDCNTFELSRSSDKITVKKLGPDELTYSYNNKSCSNSYSLDKKKAVCKQAYEESGYYEGILKQEFSECMQENMPAWFIDSDDY